METVAGRPNPDYYPGQRPDGLSRINFGLFTHDIRTENNGGPRRGQNYFTALPGEGAKGLREPMDVIRALKKWSPHLVS